MHPVEMPPAPQFTIRSATDADASAIVATLHGAFAEYRHRIQPPSGALVENVESILALLHGGESALLAESAEGAPLACVFHRPHPQHADVLYLHRLATLPAARGQGVASALVNAVEDAARASGFDYVWLGVRIALPANRTWYMKRGYYPIAYAAHAGFAQPTYITMQKRVAPPVPRKIELAEWTPAWHDAYTAAAEQLRAILGDLLLKVHHIGSTAIPNMPAKPTIDLLGIVSDLKQVERTEPRLILNGWQPRGENGIPGRLYFRKGSDAHHTHHLHIYAQGDETGRRQIRRQLAFVAWLTDHPEDAQRYANLKRDLAAQYTWEPVAYTDAKGPLVEEILARALAAWPD